MQVAVAVTESSHRVRRVVVLDEVVLDVCSPGPRKDGAKIDRPLTDIDHLIGGQPTRILDVEELESLGVAVEEVDRISAGENDPVQVYLEIDQRRIGFIEENVERPHPTHRP